MFKEIEDQAVADKLWEAGLLWFKYHANDREWRYDDTYLRRQSRNHPNDDAPSNTWYCKYAILVEE